MYSPSLIHLHFKTTYVVLLYLRSKTQIVAYLWFTMQTNEVMHPSVVVYVHIDIVCE